MAECSVSHLIVDWFGLKTDVLNMSDWTNGKDSRHIKGENSSDFDLDYQKRSNLVHAIVHNHSLEHLEVILGSGWDVNEPLSIPEHIMSTCPFRRSIFKYYEQRTVLGEAARCGWTEGVKKLLDAGAKCKTSDNVQNPLTLALQDHDCLPDLIELLLKHGADPNDANSLSFAIKNCKNHQNVRVIQLLLEHGAEPNKGSELIFLQEDALSATLEGRKFDVYAALFGTLVDFGANVNYRGPGGLPLLHRIMSYSKGHLGFLQEQLDLFFLHGGNINMEGGRHGTALEDAVRQADNDSNNIRWLIRHGADTSPMKVTLLKEHFCSKYQYALFPQTSLILLQAGMRVSHGAVTHLSNMQTAISAWLQDNSTNWEDLNSVTQVLWAQLEKAEEEGEPQRRQCKLKKSTLLRYLTQQVVDLEEFSDENRHVYPKLSVTNITDRRQKSQSDFDQIHTMLEFLKQTQSLQWYCRRSVRENLVSLQPSVVKMLPIPVILKRYILCHEI